MNLTNYFDISRFWLLLKMELFRSKKAVGMTLVTILGLLFFVGLVLDLIVGGNRMTFDHDGNFAGSLLLGGFILTSLSFNDLSNTLKTSHYLTLPVSTLEKFLCMWLLTSLGWVGLFTVVYTLYTFIANPVGQMLFRTVTFLPFAPLSDFSVNSIRVYLVLQGIFMVGAVHFQGYVLPKTLFTIVVFLLLSGIAAYFIMQDSFLIEHECNAGQCEVLTSISRHPVWVFLVSLFWWLFAPLCWVITYLGLKEKEI